jgi:hypothetical protein
LPLPIDLAAAAAVLAASDPGVGGAFASGVLIAVGAPGLVIAIEIVFSRIADIDRP